MFLLLMKKALTEDTKTSLSLARIRYSAPPPLLCIMPLGQIFLEGQKIFALDEIIFATPKIKSALDEKNIGPTSEGFCIIRSVVDQFPPKNI